MQDITFYGLNRKNSMDVSGEFGNLQRRFGQLKAPIKMPYMYSFLEKDLDQIHKNSFAWPIVSRIVLQDDQVLGPYLLNSFNDLLPLFEQIKTLNEQGNTSTLLVSKPLIRSSKTNGNYNYYLARDYIAVHNLQNGQGYLINTKCEDFFVTSGLNPNLVYRIVQTAHGYVFDGYLQYTDPRLNELHSKRIGEVFQDSANVELFRKGYRNFFYSFNWSRNRASPLTLGNGYVNDPLAFGELVGAALSFKINTVFNNAGIPFDGKISKLTLLKLKLSGNCDFADSVSDLIAFHNAIQTADDKSFCETIVSHLTGIEKPVESWEQIQDLFAVGFNCLEYSVRGVEYAGNNKQTLLVPDTLNKISVDYAFSAQKLQLRILNNVPERNLVKVRVQFIRPNFEQYITFEGGARERYAYYNAENDSALEWNVQITQADVDKDFVSFSKELSNLTYDRPSLFNSSAVYAPMEFKDQAFYSSETGLKLFPITLFKNQINCLVVDQALQNKLMKEYSDDLDSVVKPKTESIDKLKTKLDKFASKPKPTFEFQATNMNDSNFYLNQIYPMTDKYNSLQHEIFLKKMAEISKQMNDKGDSWFFDSTGHIMKKIPPKKNKKEDPIQDTSINNTDKESNNE